MHLDAPGAACALLGAQDESPGVPQEPLSTASPEKAAGAARVEDPLQKSDPWTAGTARGGGQEADEVSAHWAQQEKKRRGPDGSGVPSSAASSAAPPAPAGGFDIEAAFNSLRSSALATMDRTMGEQQAQVLALVKQQGELNARRFGEQEAALVAVVERTNAVEAAQATLAGRVQQIERAMAFVSNQRVTRAEVDEAAWDREPDPTILWFGCEAPVGRAGILETLTALCGEAGIDHTQVAVQGNPAGISKRWKIDFAATARGTACLAVSRAKKIHGLLRNADGTFRNDLLVRSPAGTQHKLFVNLDQSPKQSAIEQGAKKLKKIFDEVVQDGQTIHCNKR